ncbi:hypothetical protein ACIGW7_13255 [Streptomyces sp. NPDC053253]|uniref:hypothetical protein n=1 Tax=Streptomyces sp. NPDC053253 TaxID=3365699 RepID=UPI0037D10CB3
MLGQEPVHVTAVRLLTCFGRPRTADGPVRVPLHVPVHDESPHQRGFIPVAEAEAAQQRARYGIRAHQAQRVMRDDGGEQP